MPRPSSICGRLFRSAFGIVAQEQDAERRIAIDQDAAFAVQHGAARRDNRDVADPIAFGEIGKMAGLDDLQFPESDQQQDDEGYGKIRKKRQSPLRDFLVVNIP